VLLEKWARRGLDPDVLAAVRTEVFGIGAPKKQWRPFGAESTKLQDPKPCASRSLTQYAGAERGTAGSKRKP